MKYTDEEKSIIEKWPKTTEDDVRRLNDLFLHYLFFRWVNARTAVELRASCCGHREFLTVQQRTETPDHRALLEGLRHKAEGVCPWCGRKITRIDLSKAKYRHTLRQYETAVLLHSVGDALYADALYLQKEYRDDADLTAPPEASPCAGYRFTHGAVLELNHQVWGDCPEAAWERDRLSRRKLVQEPFKVGYIGFYTHSPYFVVAREELENNPAYRYCQYFCGWQYRPLGPRGYAKRYSDLIEYLTAYSIYPKQIEMLVKARLYGPVSDLIGQRKKNAAAMCWEEPDICKALGLNRAELREWMDGGAHLEWLELRNYARRSGKSWSLARVAAWDDQWMEPMAVLRFCRQYNLDPDRFERYINGLAFNDPQLIPDAHSMWEIYKDYLEAAYQTGLCLEHSKVLWPDDLGAAHAAATAALAASIETGTGVAAERAKDLKERREKYEYEADGLCIVFPATAAAIKREGRVLEHCVGGYAERHINGTLSIVFLRRSSAPHEPYVTIEMHGNQLIQIHGYQNECVPGAVSPRVTHKGFLEKWLRWLKAGSKRDDEGRPVVPRNRKETVA